MVITGSECTGKTTLADALARHYHTVWVPEYVREFVVEKGGAPVYADVEAIARGQIELEDRFAREAAAAAAPLLVQDTDLLSTVLYSRHYYGECPAWIEAELQDRAADLYLLTEIDVPWVPDSNQRDRGDRRQEMQGLFRTALIVRRLPFVELHGSREERLSGAIAAIDDLLGSSRSSQDGRPDA